MKRLSVIIAIICAAVLASAQSSPEIKKLFSDFATKDGTSTETIISGDALKGTELNLYRSLVISGSPDSADKIAARVLKCGTNAVGREIKYIHGKIYYARLALPPVPGETDNRYLFYLNSSLKGSDRIMLIYMSGKADSEAITKLINSK